MNPNSPVVQALKVTGEIYGRQMSNAAAAMFLADLSEYPEKAILAALSRCRKELRSFPTLADIIARIDDGRPGAEEAWASIPRDESETTVWTSEVAQAYGVAAPLMVEDQVAARMAFLESYRKLVADARANGVPVKWKVSLGHDSKQRERAITDAIKQGRIALTDAREYLPQLEAPTAAPQLTGPEAPIDAKAEIDHYLAGIKSLLNLKEEKPKASQAPVEPMPEEIEARRMAMLRQLQRMETEE